MNNIKSDRIHWIDVAKGLLMLLVVFGHMDNYAEKASITDEAIYNLCWIERFWTSFFMCAFFVISGYCSNFNKNFGRFLIAKIKSLVIPAITISILLSIASNKGFMSILKIIPHTIIYGPAWFLAAMFICCIVYWAIMKYIFRYRLIPFLILPIIGLFLYQHFPMTIKIWYLPQALMLLPFLEIGSIIKNKHILDNWHFFVYSLIVYFIMFFAISYITNFDKVGIFHKITVTWLTLLPCYICSIAGSLTILFISKFINSLSILESIGKNSIVLYLLNTQLITLYYNLYRPMFANSSSLTIVGFLTVLAITIISGVCISKLLNSKYTSFLLGKF